MKPKKLAPELRFGLMAECGAPVIVANIFDVRTKEHLMTCSMSTKDWKMTQKTKLIHCRRSRRIEPFLIGEYSGNVMKVVSQWLDFCGGAVDIYVKTRGKISDVLGFNTRIS